MRMPVSALTHALATSNLPVTDMLFLYCVQYSACFMCRGISERTLASSDSQMQHHFTVVQGCEPVARLPKMARGNISLARGIHCCPIFFFLFFRPASSYCAQCVHTSACIQTVYELPLLPYNTAVKHFYTNRSGAKCWPDIYHWGAGRAVTGRIRDIGQNVLQSAFKRK